MTQFIQLAESLMKGEITPEEFQTRALRMVRDGEPRPSADLGEMVLDLDRQRRCGFAEVIYGAGKTAESIISILECQAREGIDALATRISAEKASVLLARFPKGIYNPIARTFRLKIDKKTSEEKSAPQGKVAVISAGTSDRPVAEEAYETALWTGAETIYIQDVGVAGPDRLRRRIPDIADADAIVVVAGMEGALPSVVGGYVSAPIIAVPTSVGYGTAFGGMTALFGMLNSCASNVTVVNIDAGFKAGYVAGLIARQCQCGTRSCYSLG